MTTTIWWIRRDLRLNDNPALLAAASSGARVAAVFVLDDRLLKGRLASARRNAFLMEGLRMLDIDLRARGGQLILRAGNPVAELGKLLRELEASRIFAEADHSPFAVERDAAVAQVLPLTLVGSSAIKPPGTILKADGTPYTVFTPYMRTWKAHGLPTSRDINGVPDGLRLVAGKEFLPIPAGEAEATFPAGENEARRRLAEFSQTGLGSYAEGRNRMAVAGTARLSPYLRFGMLSAREAAGTAVAGMQAANDASIQRSAETWLNELIWRDFYISILLHFPEVLSAAFRPAFRSIRWEDDPAALTAWQQGRTGYPVVDAGMRELLATGWMHNRARMLVASFLTKNLLVDWRKGEAWFMRHLLDGDPAANNGGWQWAAGTGTDAAPYFRIFNPVVQGRKFDPGGEYVRRWVPELFNLPDAYIHAPWEMPDEVRKQVGWQGEATYPAPIVDLPFSRARALAAYAAAKSK